jgi:hypothetical protein
MKYTSSVIVLLLSVFISCAQNDPYKWTQVLPPGNGRFPENWTPGKWPMGIVPLVAFNNDLYMVGKKTVWISSNGTNWIAYSKTDWGERYGMAITFFKGKLWMMGGMKTWDKFCNDVWSSKDGKDWKQIKLHADWSERRGHSVVVYNNKMWLFGGSISTGQSNKPPTEFLNDVWVSDDGENWTNVSQHANWSAREPCVVNLNNLMFVVGGPGKTDVWHSANGKEWAMLTDKTEWSARQYNGVLVFDEKLWVFGGSGHNDVWYSVNGKNWIQQSSSAPWSKRTAYHSVVYLNKLWLYSGKTGDSDSWAGDVWIMTMDCHPEAPLQDL